jgi:hypothetical protein
MHFSLRVLHRTHSVSSPSIRHLSFARRQLEHAFCFFSRTSTGGYSVASASSSSSCARRLPLPLPLPLPLALPFPFPFALLPSIGGLVTVERGRDMLPRGFFLSGRAGVRESGSSCGGKADSAGCTRAEDESGRMNELKPGARYVCR